MGFATMADDGDYLNALVDRRLEEVASRRDRFFNDIFMPAMEKAITSVVSKDDFIKVTLARSLGVDGEISKQELEEHVHDAISKLSRTSFRYVLSREETVGYGMILYFALKSNANDDRDGYM